MVLPLVSDHIGFAYICTGEKCLHYDSLNDKELEKGNCQQLVIGTRQRHHTVECSVSSDIYYNRYHYYKYFREHNYKWASPSCLIKWCSYIASCLNQTQEWKQLCSKKFYWFWSSQFDISGTVKGVNVSYVRNIHIKHCRTITYPYRDNVSLTFSIRTTGYSCNSENSQNGKYM